mgnify:CR=1 FL=1
MFIRVPMTITKLPAKLPQDARQWAKATLWGCGRGNYASAGLNKGETERR